MENTQMNNIIIIDGNNYCYRAWYKFINLKSKKGEGSGIIYGVPLMIGSLLKTWKANKVYFVIDGKRNLNRLSVLPGYKEGRKKYNWDADEFHKQKDITVDLLHNALGITVIHNKDQEADDMMYKLVRKHKDDNVMLCSSDKDFNQLISDKVSIWNHNLDSKRGVKLTPLNAKEWIGYEPNQCVDYLTFIGDSSDKIPGVSGIGEVGARNFLDKYNSIKNYLKNCEEDKKYKKDILAEVYKVSRYMIDLKFFHRKHLRRVTPMEAFKIESKVDYIKLKEIGIKYNINQFIIGNFIKPFENYKDNEQ